MKDKALFWGRQAEVEALYQKTFNSRLLILCGERGTGKTSLIQCGLANRIQEGRWNPIYIPGNQKADRVLLSTITLKLNAVFDRELGKAETGAYSETRPEIKTEALKALKQLYEWTFQPIFLIFDQLEDRFDAGDKKELDAFFDLLKKIIEDKGFPCKIILILREAHLGALARYEELIPGLLDHRYHLGIMQPDTLRPAVSGMLDILQNTRQIQLTQPELVKDHITNQLNQKKCPPKLGCLQIYLHQLHQDACRQSKGEMPVFDLQLINRVGSSEKAIDSYIRSRRKSMEKQVCKGKTKSPSPAVIRVLCSQLYSCPSDSTVAAGVGIT